MPAVPKGSVSESLSIVRGIPLDEETGIGALTVPGYLREVTGRFAGNEAVIHHGAGRVERWTYAQLSAHALAVARALVAGGIGRDSRVGILMTNRPEFLAAAFGTALAGGVFVPLNTFSTPVELEHLIRVSGISTLLFEQNVAAKDYAEVLAGLVPEMSDAEPGRLLSNKFPELRRIVMLGLGDHPLPAGGAVEAWEEFLVRGENVPPELIERIAAATTPSDTSAIFFSSGSTSTPKGIIHNHRAIALQWWRWPWMYTDGRDIRIWTANAFFWSGPFSLVLGNAFTTGGAVILQSTFDAEEALALMQSERVTVPLARRHQWARIEESPNYPKADLASLRCFDAKKLLHDVHPTITAQWRDPRPFGTTETLTNFTLFPPNTPDELMDGSYGPPLPGNILKIVDPTTGEIVPLGDRGEIAVKGPTLMQGYLGKTADETFDPDGFYLTGDGGYIGEKGHLFWEGRLNDIIKTGGANVSPGEIDLAIAAYPGVKITQTVGVPDDMLGEMVVSCIVPQDGTTIDEQALRGYLKERLASYKMPRRILFFQAEEVSLTGSGAKIKAGDMRERAIKRLAAESDDT